METQNRGIIGNIAKAPISFSVSFIVFFFAIVGFLAYADALPEPIEASAQSAVIVSNTELPSAPTAAETAENPVKIVIEKLGMNVLINNPVSTDVDTLDHALLSGAVRYPTSARLGQKGTVLLFGHSSNLPVIHNQAFKAFKGIQNLKNGDLVSVYSATQEYRYSVTGVSVANADEDVVELRQDGKYLTLVTCDTFSKKSARFIVQAKFVGAYPLTSR
jgi:LPXTG-site transpeptidase (sortase) family protein